MYNFGTQRNSGSYLALYLNLMKLIYENSKLPTKNSIFNNAIKGRVRNGTEKKVSQNDPKTHIHVSPVIE